jgi:hypothetical protein
MEHGAVRQPFSRARHDVREIALGAEPMERSNAACRSPAVPAKDLPAIGIEATH